MNHVTVFLGSRLMKTTLTATKNLMFVLVIAMLVSTAQGQGYYEDFETTGHQYTLWGQGAVNNGYLTTTDDWWGGAVLDGEYMGTPSDPSIKTTTFNLQGNTFRWTSLVHFFGTDGTNQLETHHGMPIGVKVRYMANDTSTLRVYDNNATEQLKLYDVEHPMPGGFDIYADYEFVVEDYGDSVTLWVQNAADPSIRTTEAIVDISGIPRMGNKDAVTFLNFPFYPDEGGTTTGGIDSVSIVPEPATIVSLGLGLSLGLGGLLLRRRRS